MDNGYYILNNGEQEGPFTFEELTAFELDVHTRVQSPLTGVWEDACDIPELYGYFISIGINFPTEDNLATFWWRLLAYVIDLLMLSFIAAIIIQVLAVNKIVVDLTNYNDLLKIDLVLYIVLIVYNTICESTRMKGTLGKKLCGLVVVDVDGVKLTFFNALLRNLGKAVSLYFFGLGFISIFFSEHRQAMHDYFAKTYVVKV